MKDFRPIIFIISGNKIFAQLIEASISIYLKNPGIVKISSFNELKEKYLNEPVEIIILDDIIPGASALEIITFLRFNRILICPIYLFCEDAPDFISKALNSGANRCIIKPFKPLKVVEEIINIKNNKS